MSALNLMLRPNLHNRTFDWIGDSYGPYIDDGHFMGHGLLGARHNREIQHASVPTAEGESIFEIAVPGFAKEDISLSLADDILTISGKGGNVPGAEDIYLRKEFELCPFEFRFQVREPLDLQNIRAECNNGMLRLFFKDAKGDSESGVHLINIT